MTMKRPADLYEIPLDETLLPKSVNITMSEGQWDALLMAAYNAGYNLIELDKNERPIRAYRRYEI